MAAAEAAQRLSHHWSLRVRVESQAWRTYHGLDTAYAVEGAGIETQYTRLNRVAWDSLSVGLAAVCHF